MKKTTRILLTIGLGVAALTTLPAQASVVMTDGMSVVYDPNETYLPSGQLGADIFSIGFTFNNPAHATTIGLTAPGTMPGFLGWLVSSERDGAGTPYYDGALSAGQSASVPILPSDWASPNNPVTAWFSMQALGLTTPLDFGPNGLNLITAGGLPNQPPSAVPLPAAGWLFLSALGLFGFGQRRRAA